MSNFKPIQHQKVYLEIAEQITDAISKGEYKPGEKLPSERNLAELINTSRSSVREAISVLDAIGIVEVKTGQGIFVSYSLDSQSFSFKQDMSPYDLAEARVLFEKSLAEVIINRATNKHLQKLEQAVTKMEALSIGEENLDDCYKWGIEFHRIYASLAGNDVITNIGNGLVDSASHPMWKLLNRRALFSFEIREEQIQEHWSILNALRKKDVNLTRQAIQAHLGNLQKGMFI